MTPSPEVIRWCRRAAEQNTGKHTAAWYVYHSPYRPFAFTAAGKAITSAGGCYCDQVAFTPKPIPNAGELEIVEI